MATRERVQKAREATASAIKSFQDSFKEFDRLIDSNASDDKLVQAIAESGIPEDAFIDAYQRYTDSGGIVDYGAGRALLQGLSFGFSDEIEAALPSAITGLKGDYEQRVGQIRAGQKAFEAAEPETALAAEVLGSLPYMALPAVGGARMASMAGRAPSLARTMGYGMGIGATEGAIGGVGRGEGAADSAQRALTEGALGAGLGALAPAAVAGGARLMSRGGSAQDQAISQLGRVIPEEARGGVSERIAQRAAETDARPETLADIAGIEAQRELRGLRGGSAEVQAKTDPFIEQRMFEQGERIKTDVQAGLGLTPDDTTNIKKVISRQESAAAPLYRQIRKDNPEIDVSDMIDIFERPSFKNSFDDIMGALRDREGRTVPKGTYGNAPETYDEFIDNLKTGKDTTVPFDFLDQAKRVIGSKGQGAKKDDADLGERLFGVAGEIRDAADAKIPAYKEARRVFAGEAEIEEAYDAGKKFGTASAEEITETLTDLTSDSARQAFLTGAVEDIRKLIESANDGADVVKRVAGSPAKRKKLAAVMGGENSPAFKAFMDAMNREAEMVKSGRLVAGGSQTAAFQQDIQRAGLGFDDVVDVLMNPTQVANVPRLTRLFQGVINTATGKRGRTGEVLSDYLLETDPRKQQAALDAILAASRRAEQGRRNVSTAGMTASGAAGMIPSLLDAGE
jgi:hypothetical protein